MFRLIPFCILSVLVFTGCGGEFKTAPVSGTIKLDGEPLENASVTFTPQTPSADGAIPISVGRTDATGKYTLTLIATEDSGAVLGAHNVNIALVGPEDEDNDVEEESSEAEQLPDHTLTFEVKSGANQADFELTSGG